MTGSLSTSWNATRNQFAEGGWIHEHVGDAYRGVGSGLKNLNSLQTFDKLADSFSTTVNGFDPRIGEKLSFSTDSPAFVNIKNMPISPNFTIASFAGAVTSPFENDNLSRVLDEVTGININEMTEIVSGTRNVEERVKEYILGVERMIIQEIKDCIDKYLTELITKNEALGLLFGLEEFVKSQFGLLKRDIRLGIEDELNVILYQKIKLQQIGQFKQKITAKVRQICPGHNSPPKVTRISPTLTKNLQNDKTWELVDGVKPLKENALSRSPKDIYDAEQPNSTGDLLTVLAKEAAEDVAVESLAQSLGRSAITIDDFFDEAGVAV